MGRMISRTGKQTRPKTAIKGKRYLCAKCRKRSPKPVKTPAPWYCPRCLKRVVREDAEEEIGSSPLDAQMQKFEKAEGPQS